MRPGYEWDITRATNLRKFNGVIPLNIIIEKSEWEEFVEKDPSMVWFEDTALGKKMFSDPLSRIPKNTIALWEHNEKTGKCSIRFSLPRGLITANVAPITKRKRAKIFEIADYFDAKVYKLFKEIKKDVE